MATRVYNRKRTRGSEEEEKKVLKLEELPRLERERVIKGEEFNPLGEGG